MTKNSLSRWGKPLLVAMFAAMGSVAPVRAEVQWNTDAQFGPSQSGIDVKDGDVTLSPSPVNFSNYSFEAQQLPATSRGTADAAYWTEARSPASCGNGSLTPARINYNVDLPFTFWGQIKPPPLADPSGAPNEWLIRMKLSDLANCGSIHHVILLDENGAELARKEVPYSPLPSPQANCDHTWQHKVVDFAEFRNRKVKVRFQFYYSPACAARVDSQVVPNFSGTVDYNVLFYPSMEYTQTNAYVLLDLPKGLAEYPVSGVLLTPAQEAPQNLRWDFFEATQDALGGGIQYALQFSDDQTNWVEVPVSPQQRISYSGKPKRYVRLKATLTRGADTTISPILNSVLARQISNTAPSATLRIGRDLRSDRSVDEGRTAQLILDGMDLNSNGTSDPLTYRILSSDIPAAESFQLVGNVFEWTVSHEAATPAMPEKDYHITFGVSDGTDEIPVTTTIKVLHINRPPELVSIGGKPFDSDPNFSVNEGELLELPIIVRDLDGDALDLALTTRPNGAILDRSVEPPVFRWTPTNAQTGMHQIVFQANSVYNGVTSSAISDAIILVGNVPHPPQLTVTGNTRATVGQKIDLQISAQDPDPGETINVTAALPAGALFSRIGLTNDYTMTWTPGAAQAGIYKATFTAVSSGGLRDEQVIDLTVQERPLRYDVRTYLNGAEVDTVYVNEPFEVRVTLYYRDGALELAQTLNANISLTAEGTGTLSGLNGSLPLTGGRLNVTSLKYDKAERIRLQVQDLDRGDLGIVSVSVIPSQNVFPDVSVAGYTYQNFVRAGQAVSVRAHMVNTLGNPIVGGNVLFRSVEGPARIVIPVLTTNALGEAEASVSTTGNSDGDAVVDVVNMDFPDRIQRVVIKVYGPPTSLLMGGQNSQIISSSVRSQDVTALPGQVVLGKPSTEFHLLPHSRIGVSAVEATLDGEPQDPAELSSFTLPLGFHRIQVRAQALDGEWGPIQEFQVKITASLIPGEFKNRPNPFEAGREDTILEYNLESPSHVSLKIYSLMGHSVWERDFAPGDNPGGMLGDNQVPWNGRNNEGVLVGNGGYIAELRVDGKPAIRRKIAVEK